MSETIERDVVIFGGTPAGLMAAAAAAKHGCSVLVVEPERHIGGMVSGGLGRTDVNGSQYVGGLTKRYFDEVASRTPVEEQTPGRPWDLEAHVAMEVFRKWVSEAGYRLIEGRRVK
ncbi:FAD-dependent oxidoreductase, partial [bacterium]|nr:FAD-dependent oxidoreductase [bacterium]